MNFSYQIKGPTRWIKLEPANRVRKIDIGGDATFKIWIIARPFPRPDQWHWRFSPSNTYYRNTTNPANVHLRASKDVAILDITKVTQNHYGGYFVWANNAYGGWKEDNLNFSLTSACKSKII